MKILYIGHAVPADGDYSALAVPGNNMQLGLTSALHQDENIDLHIITIPPVAHYPKDKHWFYRKQMKACIPSLNATHIGFINLPIIKQISQTLSVFFTAKKFIKKNPDAIVFTINTCPQVGLPAVWLKTLFHVRIVAYLSDSPVEEKLDRHGIDKLIRKAYNRRCIRSINEYDQLVAVNKHTITLYAPDKPFIVVDGALTLNEPQMPCVSKPEVKNMIYSGALTEYSGITPMISAMEYLKDDDIELHIYGSGYLQGAVETAALQNPKIKYFGQIPNAVMKAKQSEAWLLVSPRPINHPVIMVTFPSKIFEYLSSGTPVLSTRLNGFTAEYEGKLFFTDGDTPEDLANKIHEIDQMDPLIIADMVQRAYNFISKERNWTVQAKKIYNFLK